MGLIILRVVFVLVAAGVGVQLINSDALDSRPGLHSLAGVRRA